jgi:thiamine-monophosphate kinase
MPVDFLLADFDAFIDGFVSLGEREKVALVGGNLTRSPGPIVIDVTLIGTARPRRILTRSGGRPGHELYLTGSIGAAAAGLAHLQAGGSASRDAETLACIARCERPDARVRCGVQVARTAPRRAVDLSDGLADAAGQLANASRTGVILEAEAIPLHPGARGLGGGAGSTQSRLVSRAGRTMNYCFRLVLDSGGRFWRLLPVVTDGHRVGRLTAEPGQWISRAGETAPLGAGFTHF